MKSLDTNILIRFLVNDDKSQGQKVKRLFDNAQKNGNVFFISLPVLLELMYVLKSVYCFTRDDILMALESMMSLPAILFEKPDAIQYFISTGRKLNLELEDLLIGTISHYSGCETTLTFNKKAARSHLFELIE